MAMNTLSKNSISIIVALLLVIILSETKLFFFFTESYLGRSILILILLFASYLNKILGVVCVFIIIIMFSSNRLVNFEGFDSNMSASSNEKIQKVKDAIAEKINEYNPNPTTSTPGENGSGTYQPTNMPGANGSGTYQPTSALNNSQNPSKINVTAPSSNSKKNVNNAMEGFDLQSTENNIKRGKQSNSIQVNPSLKNSLDVSPYEGNVHGSFYGEGFSVY